MVKTLFYLSHIMASAKKSSTQHAIVDSVNVIQNNMDQKFFTFGIFLDLKKAFDTVDH